MSELPRLIAVMGTNASGKSDLGVELALRYNGEIVSADSRQVYRGLDLGSGKITPEGMKGVRHHLIDICDVNTFFSMADFQRAAYEAIDDIIARGKTPFLVGGTGLYIESVCEGYVLSGIQPDLEYRAYLETKSTPVLYATLMQLRPGADVDPSNRNRVMRQLEKIHDGDESVSPRVKRYDTLKIGVTWDRDTLAARIDERLERRMKAGMVDEVRDLLENGADKQFLMKLGLEYRFLTRYIDGEFSSEEEMCELLATAIRQFAKRQRIWFRRDADINWLDMKEKPLEKACALIDSFTADDNGNEAL